MTLWHNGHKVLTAPANTGIPGAETALGTYPVFEHLEETTMSGKTRTVPTTKIQGSNG